MTPPCNKSGQPASPQTLHNAFCSHFCSGSSLGPPLVLCWALPWALVGPSLGTLVGPLLRLRPLNLLRVLLHRHRLPHSESLFVPLRRRVLPRCPSVQLFLLLGALGFLPALVSLARYPAAAGAGLSLAPAPIAYGTGVLGSTVSAAHATAQHQLVADAAQAAATNQARHPSRTLPVQTARGRLEGGPAGSAPPRRTHVRGGASAPAAVARACRAAVPFGRAQRRGGLLGMAASAHGL